MKVWTPKDLKRFLRNNTQTHLYTKQNYEYETHQIAEKLCLAFAQIDVNQFLINQNKDNCETYL